jgi:hypothetical protein
MNAKIAFGGLKKIRWWRSKFLQYSHIQILSCTKGVSWWRYTIQLYASITILFFLEVIVWVLHYKSIEGLSKQWGYCIVDYRNSALKPSLMREWLILSWPKSMFFFDIWGYCSFGFMVHVNHLWLLKILCGMWHDKYVE